MEGGYYGFSNNGEKRFWRTRLVFIIGLSIIILFCSFFISGNITFKAHHVDSLLHQQDDPTNTAEIIYINNPEIEVYMEKIRIFMYVDIALKALLLIVCVSLIVVVYSALRIHQGPERESLLESPSYPSSLPMTSTIPSLSLSSDGHSEIIREGVVYEPYTEAVIVVSSKFMFYITNNKTLANDEATPAFNKVSSALYKYGPKAAHKMLEKLESTLSQEEIQYFNTYLSERNN